jgi:hypothetical protein
MRRESFLGAMRKREKPHTLTNTDKQEKDTESKKQERDRARKNVDSFIHDDLLVDWLIVW